jgi:hypothetical protein
MTAGRADMGSLTQRMDQPFSDRMRVFLKKMHRHWWHADLRACDPTVGDNRRVYRSSRFVTPMIVFKDGRLIEERGID